MSSIHPSAVVDPQVELGPDVTIGPYVVIEGKVQIGGGSVIEAHSVLKGSTVIGAGCKIGPAAYIGLDAQHLGYKGEESWAIIGDRLIARENVTINRSFKPGRENATRVGNDCFLMATSHIGHDCIVGDRVIMANSTMLGGHVTVGERTFLGGGTAVHQFCRIGRLVITRGNEAVTQDVPPFAAAMFNGLKGYNAIGCRRAGLSREAIQSIRKAYHCFHENRTVPAMLRAVRETVPQTPEVLEFLAFFEKSHRGFRISARFLGRSAHDADEGEE